MGSIYVLGASQEGPVKIGFTLGAVSARLAALQTAHHQRLHVLTAVEVPDAWARRIERHLHLVFQQQAIRGEWFAVGISHDTLVALVSHAQAMITLQEPLLPSPTAVSDPILPAPDDSEQFLDPDPCAMIYPSDEGALDTRVVYTYGTDDEEIVLAITTPEASESILQVQRIVGYYLALL